MHVAVAGVVVVAADVAVAAVAAEVAVVVAAEAVVAAAASHVHPAAAVVEEASRVRPAVAVEEEISRVHRAAAAASTDPPAAAVVAARVRRNCHPVARRAQAAVVADECRRPPRNVRPVVTVHRLAAVWPICLRLAAASRNCRPAIVRAQAPVIVRRNFPVVRIVPEPARQAGPRNFPASPERVSQIVPVPGLRSARAKATSATFWESPGVPPGVQRLPRSFPRAANGPVPENVPAQANVR